jgi:hypothetical protein
MDMDKAERGKFLCEHTDESSHNTCVIILGDRELQNP